MNIIVKCRLGIGRKAGHKLLDDVLVFYFFMAFELPEPAEQVAEQIVHCHGVSKVGVMQLQGEMEEQRFELISWDMMSFLNFRRTLVSLRAPL